MSKGIRARSFKKAALNMHDLFIATELLFIKFIYKVSCLDTGHISFYITSNELLVAGSIPNLVDCKRSRVR